MPWIDIVSQQETLSLWYITNTQNENASSFDPAKPTILMLHPLFLDSSWLMYQADDPRLYDAYNIIAFDLRSCGRTRAKPTPLRDNWAEAADLAFAHEALRLPPVHVYAVNNLSTMIALRWAAMFPEMIASLTLCNVPPQIEQKWAIDATEDLLRSLCFPEDYSGYEVACGELTKGLLGGDSKTHTLLKDELVLYWMSNQPPFRRARLVDSLHGVLNRQAMPQQALDRVTCPVLIIQGDQAEMHPVKYADELAASLKNVEGGATVYVVKGGAEYMNITPSHTSIVTKVLTSFLSRLPQVPSKLRHGPSDNSTFSYRIAEVLQLLADWTGNPEIASRPRDAPLSFSLVGEKLRQVQEETLKKYSKDAHKAVSPLGSDGRPLRRISERDKDHWFQGDLDGVSYSDSSLLAGIRESASPEKPAAASSSTLSKSTSSSSTPSTFPEPVSAAAALQRASHNRRPTYAALGSDKKLVKDNMRHIITNTKANLAYSMPIVTTSTSIMGAATSGIALGKSSIVTAGGHRAR